MLITRRNDDCFDVGADVEESIDPTSSSCNPFDWGSLSLVPGSLPVCLGFSIPDTDLVNVGDVQAGMTSVMSLAYVPQ